MYLECLKKLHAIIRVFKNIGNSNNNIAAMILQS